jgi:hypothetical protein
MADQDLFDALSGAAGHPVNRPALNAYITQGQAQAGLRTAQTEEALANAENLRREQAAQDGLEDNLTQMYVQQGMSYDQANANAKGLGAVMKSHFGNYQQAAAGALDALKTQAGTKLLDPNTPPDAAIRADQVMNPGANPYQVDQGQLIPRMQQNGQSGPPTVFQTPGSQATQGAQTALAGLHGVQAAAGGYNPHAGQGGAPLDPNAIAFGAYQLYKTGKMPALGMGSGPGRSAILAGAAQLANSEAQGQDVSNPGFDTAIANGQDYAAAGRALGSFAGGPLGNQARALNNSTGHLRLFEDTFTALNNGDIPLVNSLSAKWKQATGQPAPTTLQAMASIIGPELTKILTNTNAGTGEERASFAQNAGSLSNAPDQMGDAIHAIRGMLGRQATDLALQYHGATGRNDFARRYLQPDVATDLQLTPDAAAQTVGPGGVAVPPAPAAAGGGGPPAGGPAASTPNPAAAPAEGSTAFNRKTNQRIVFHGGKWQPVTQ